MLKHFEATIARHSFASACAESDDQARERIRDNLKENGLNITLAAWRRDGMPVRLAGNSTGTTTFAN